MSSRGWVSGSVRLLDRYYRSRPEWVDQNCLFRDMIAKRLHPTSVVLDVGAGAGRGYFFTFKGSVRRLVGIDISPAVVTNPFLDEGICTDGERIPFPGAHFDVAFSSFVLEHVRHPKEVLHEIYRVLKPGGYFIFRTPSKWHYVPVVARLLPNRVHGRLLAKLNGFNPDDVYPKFYRANTEGFLRSASTEVGFKVEELTLHESAPSYLSFSPVLFALGIGYERLVNRFTVLRHLRGGIRGVLRK